MGLTYFAAWENVDIRACNNCQHLAHGKKGYKYFCKSKGNGSNDMDERENTSMECSEWGINGSVNAEVAAKSKGKGIVGKLAEKAKGEVKKAVLRDLHTIGRNIGKGI